MQISSQNSIHIWLENNCFGSLNSFCVCISLKIKMRLIWLNDMFQLEAALSRRKSLVGMDSFGTILPINMYFETCSGWC